MNAPLRRTGALFACWLIGTSALHGQSLADLIRPLAEAHEGEVSVAIEHLSDHRSFEYRADEPMPTASLIKFPLMIAAYHQAEAGEFDLAKTVVLNEDDKVPGSGILTRHFSAGTTLTVRDAIRLMMVYSDNTATNLVIDQVGLPAVADLMNSLGCPRTQMNSKVFRRDTSVAPDRSQQFGLGNTTASEMVQLLTRLHDRSLVSRQASKRMLDHMLACESRDKIPSRLPSGTKVAHKTGAISSVRCDAGIVQGPDDQAFAICVLTRKNKDQRWSDDNAANRLCGEIARAAYDHFFGKVETESLAPRVLRLGAGGRLVEALQRTLNARIDPSPGISVDGDFGPNTRATVIDFQLQNGLTATGEVDEATWKALGTLLFDEEPVPDPKIVNQSVIKKQPADDLNGPPPVTCDAWIIADAVTGQPRWGHRQHESLPMASTTKIMTAYVVLKLAESDPTVMNDSITFSRAADQTIGSTCGIRAGERVPVRELLYGLLLPSGNDASVALAEHFGSKLAKENGTVAKADKPLDPVMAFVDEMNRTAQDLGLSATHFKNTHGLTAPGHHSSAHDLMTLAWHAMKDPVFRGYVATPQRGCTVTGPGGYRRNVRWRNTNRLLKTDGYDGVKTGTTSAAGACLVSQQTRQGESLIVVVLGSSSSDARYADTRNLYRWGFLQRETDGGQDAETTDEPASDQ